MARKNLNESPNVLDQIISNISSNNDILCKRDVSETSYSKRSRLRYQRRNSAVASMLFPVTKVSMSGLTSLLTEDSSESSLNPSLHFSSRKNLNESPNVLDRIISNISSNNDVLCKRDVNETSCSQRSRPRYQRRNSAVASMLFPVTNVSISGFTSLLTEDSSESSLNASLHSSFSQVEKLDPKDALKRVVELTEAMPLAPPSKNRNIHIQKQTDFQETVTIDLKNMKRKRQRGCLEISA